MTDLSHSEDWGNPRRQAAVTRLAKPILRFLRRQIGRRWADINKELDERCHQVHAGAELRGYVRDRVFGAVVSAAEGAADTGRAFLPFRRVRLYVDPRTGILCVDKPR